MFSRSRFGEVLKGFPRGAFDRVVDAHGADKHSKGFRSWDQLVAMLFSQLSGSRSLREVEVGLNTQIAHHYHLGTRPVCRSTLAEANQKRPAAVFEATCKQLMSSLHGRLRSELGQMLYLIDSTPIPLKGLGYDDWARGQRSSRTQGLKVHLMVACGRHSLPVEQVISAANVNDIEVGRGFALESGATYVFDKGYCDYHWWDRIDQADACFVTRLKRNAGIVVQRDFSDCSTDGVILADEVIRFRHRRPGGQRINPYYGRDLRRVIVARPDKATPLVLVTNDFKRPATEIADLYRQRWEIELFFKWLKQNLKIKRFLGRSENAVRIQLYTALIAYLLVYLYHRRLRSDQPLKLLLCALATGLFSRPQTEHTTHQRRRSRRLALASLQPQLAL